MLQSEYINASNTAIYIIVAHKSFGWRNTSGIPQNEQANKQTKNKEEEKDA